MIDRENGLSRRKVIDIRICGLVEAPVAIADLQKNETLLLCGHCLGEDTDRGRRANLDRRKYACSRPGHALFKQNEQRLAIIETPLQGWVQS